MIDKDLDIQWSLRVKERDNYTCQYCGKRANEAHHIIKRAIMSTRWDVDNGITLCQEHHTISAKFSAHNTSAKFKAWIDKKLYKTLLYKSREVAHYADYEKKEILKRLKLK